LTVKKSYELLKKNDGRFDNFKSSIKKSNFNGTLVAFFNKINNKTEVYGWIYSELIAPLNIVKGARGKPSNWQILDHPIFGKSNVSRIAFADSLKVFASGMGWDGKKDERGGALLQKLGSVGREYNEDVWVNKAIESLRWYHELTKGEKTICFTDYRYPNEIQRIKSLSWIVGKVITVRIDRPGHISNRPDHISETALDDYDFDYRIVNDGSLEEYRQKVVELVEKVLEGEK